MSYYLQLKLGPLFYNAKKNVRRSILGQLQNECNNTGDFSKKSNFSNKVVYANSAPIMIPFEDRDSAINVKRNTLEGMNPYFHKYFLLQGINNKSHKKRILENAAQGQF